MKTIDGYQMARQVLGIAWLFAAFAWAPVSARAQTAPPAKGAPAAAASAANNANGLGFSIESEMLTYRALESNSQAVACDIGAYLTGGAAQFSTDPKKPVCTIAGGTNQKAGIVIVPSDGATTVADFRLWRADMEIMADLRFRASAFCPESDTLSVSSRGAAAGGPPAGPPVPPFLAGAGSALGLAQGLAGMFASETSSSAVGGTIHDQAFMDGVARELRAFGISVLMPALYVPSSLTAGDVARSPFLSSLDRLIAGRVCLKDMETQAATPALAKSHIAQITAEIDSYLATFQSEAPQTQKPPAAARPGGAAVPAEAPPIAAPAGTSPLLSILSADDLAQKLGVDPKTGLQPDDADWKHVLLVKALESGGTVTKTSNIFGTKIRYSGGSVGTFSLFTLNGELECSGNVYAYGGSVPAKRFEEEMRHYLPDPSSQFIFQKGSCRAPAVTRR